MDATTKKTNVVELVTRLSKENELLKKHYRILKSNHNALLLLTMDFLNKVAALVEKEKQTTELEVTMLKKESATQQSKGQNNNG